MAEITIFTASRTLQGPEVRSKMDSSFAKLYHDLDLGLTPINFIMPWVPLPRNWKRDAAQRKMREIYMDIISARRQHVKKDSHDMIWNLMQCVYKDGTPLPDKEIAHLMIALLMGGQHSSSSVSSWIMLRLAANPHVMEELYQEQVRELGDLTKPLRFEDLDKLTLNKQVIKETLRLHSPIHSIMRKVMNPLHISGTDWTVPPNHVLLASPGASGRSSDSFHDPETWNPHRWDTRIEPEGADDEKVDYGYGLISKGTKSPYLPFGAGRHRCIGEKFAYLNLGVIVAVMVREFKFENLDGQKGVVPTDFSVSSLIHRLPWYL